jgi:hypothetical protein
MSTPNYVSTAIALRRSHPAAPVLDVLDLAMEGQHLETLNGDEPWLAPESAFGQLLALAFDRVMTPAEWRGLIASHEPIRGVWNHVVVRLFKDRYSGPLAARAAHIDDSARRLRSFAM